MAHFTCSQQNDAYGFAYNNSYNNPASTISNYSNDTCGHDCNNSGCNNNSRYGCNDSMNDMYGTSFARENNGCSTCGCNNANTSCGCDNTNSSCSCCPLFYVIIALLIILFFNH